MRARAARRAWYLRVAAFLALLENVLLAQVTVAGRVVDENDSAVSGARVEFREAAGGRSAMTTSDGQGRFRLQLLSPGAYSIHAERPGFYVLEKAPATIPAGEQTVNITLNHLHEFVESIDVKYSPPAIDPAQTSDQKELNNVEILEVPYPSSHDLRNALPMFSGVVQDNQSQSHFNGGALDQTSVTLDGFNIADAATGEFDARVSIDAVRGLDLESGRFSAEKGRGSAGSLDVKTGMGDDHWRFSATNFIPGVSTKSGLFIDKWTPRVTFSGPIARGRAWFYNGFDTYYDVTTISGLPHGQNQSRSVTTSDLSRFQVNLTASNILTGSYLINYIDANRQGLSFLDPVETTTNQRQSFSMATVKDQIYFHGGALVEFGFAFTRGLTRLSPQGANTYEISPSGHSGNYFEDLTRHTEREQGLVNLFLPSWHYAGKHEVKLGVDLQRSNFDETVVRHDYEVLRTDGSVARLVSFFGDGLLAKSNFETSAYLLDQWTLREGLLLHLGIRTDWDQIVRDLLFSPRLSLAWMPKLLAGTKIAAGFGVFADAPNLTTLTRHQDQEGIATFYSPNGQVMRGPVTTTFAVDERSLRLPNARVWSLTIERKLPLGLHGKAGYLRRAETDGFTFVGFNPSPASVVYTLVNGRENRYDAVDLSVRRTFAGQYECFAGYTWSRARSNAVIDYSLENPIYAPQGPGPLNWDTPHRFLSWGWAPLPARLLPPGSHLLLRNTDVTYLAEARSGFPFSVVNESGFMVGAPNSRRLPSYFNINLHLERKFRFMHHQWAFRYGVYNLTGHTNPNVVNNNIDSPMFLSYGGGQTRAFNVRLRFLGRR